MQFKEHQFVFSISSKQPTKFSNAVSKLDVKNGSSKQWFQPGCITTEPLMIPRPGATAEVSTTLSHCRHSVLTVLPTNISLSLLNTP